MFDIYCHSCGGFISDPRHIEYRLPAGAAELANPHSGFCCCRPPVLYGAPGVYLSSPVMPVMPVIPVVPSPEPVGA